jgi:hypothetical protein
MRRSVFLTVAAVTVLGLCGCNDSYENPTAAKMKTALSELNPSAIIDTVNNLQCDDLGKGKFFCSYEISYIGYTPEKKESCVYSGATDFSIEANSRCY